MLFRSDLLRVLCILCGGACAALNLSDRGDAASSLGEEELYMQGESTDEMGNEDNEMENEQFEQDLLTTVTLEDLRRVIQLNEKALADTAARHSEDLEGKLSSEKHSVSWSCRVLAVLRKAKEYIETDQSIVPVLINSSAGLKQTLDSAIGDMEQTIFAQRRKVLGLIRHTIPAYAAVLDLLRNNPDSVWRVVNGEATVDEEYSRLPTDLNIRRFRFLLLAIKWGLVDVSANAAKIRTLKDMGERTTFMMLGTIRPFRNNVHHPVCTVFGIPMTIANSLASRRPVGSGQSGQFMLFLTKARADLNTLLAGVDVLVQRVLSLASTMPAAIGQLTAVLGDLISCRGMICERKGEMDAVFDACSYIAQAKRTMCSAAAYVPALRNIAIAESYIVHLENNMPSLAANVYLLYTAMVHARDFELQALSGNTKSAGGSAAPKKKGSRLPVPELRVRRQRVAMWKECMCQGIAQTRAHHAELMKKHAWLNLLPREDKPSPPAKSAAPKSSRPKGSKFLK